MQTNSLIVGKMNKFVRLAENYGLELILLFGSQSRGDLNPESDIDIAVYGNEVLGEIKKIGIIYELCKMLDSDKIDLVDIKTASPLLKKEIFMNYTILYLKNPMLLYQLELVSMYEFKESAILYQMRHEKLKEFVG